MSIPDSAEKIGRPKSPDSELRELLAALIKRCSKSRAQIAEQMSVHAGQPISKRMLDDWTAESKKAARFPAAFIEAFCEAVGNDDLQCFVMGERLRTIVELRNKQVRWLADSLRAELFNRKRAGRKSKAEGK
jgi:hypothetical protein